LVINYTASPSDPDFYTITDKLVILGCFSTETKYTARFTQIENGANFEVRAGLGTKLTTRWTVRSIEGGAELREESTVEVHFQSVHCDAFNEFDLARPFSS
jgi:hypothetical protein